MNVLLSIFAITGFSIILYLSSGNLFNLIYELFDLFCHFSASRGSETVICSKHFFMPSLFFLFFLQSICLSFLCNTGISCFSKDPWGLYCEEQYSGNKTWAAQACVPVVKILLGTSASHSTQPEFSYQPTPSASVLGGSH